RRFGWMTSTSCGSVRACRRLASVRGCLWGDELDVSRDVGLALLGWQMPVAQDGARGDDGAGDANALPAVVAPEGAVAGHLVEAVGVHQLEPPVAAVRTGETAQVAGRVVGQLVHVDPFPERGHDYGLLGSGRIR